MPQEGDPRDTAVEDDLAFFGSATASLSHQLNNVFTIINEINGLLEDQLYLGDQGRELSLETIRRVVEKTGRHVQRGAEYVVSLNQLAHTTDQLRVSVSLVDWLALAGKLFLRFAELRQATLDVAQPAEALVVPTSPFLLLQAVFRCLEAVLADAPSGRALTLETRATATRIALLVRVDAPCADEAVGATLAQRLRGLLIRLDGELVLTATETGTEIQLWLPRVPENSPDAGGTVSG